ncbi:MAG: zinc-binding dehydrogenase [Kofleriaceae bacterium]
MKAWQLEKLGGSLQLNDVAVPEVRPGSVLVKVSCGALLSYQRDYVEGKLPHYSPPDGFFTIGTNAIGRIEKVGRDVWHLKAGDRVFVSPHMVARENVVEPAQALIGLTAYGDGKKLQADWRDGPLAEYLLTPAATLTPIEGLDWISDTQLITLMRYAVPYGGLVRGRLAAGETVVVTGATGAFGTAAVYLAVAMGAGRVIAAGRNRAALDALKSERVTPVVLSGELEADVAMLRAYQPSMAFDIVGRATDPNATLAALRSLQRNGRLVIMGSMAVPLPIPYGDVMINNWEIIGQFMYDAGAVRSLLGLARSKQLDLSRIAVKEFAFKDLRAGMDAAAAASNTECVVVTM